MNKGRLLITRLVQRPAFFELSHAEQQHGEAKSGFAIVRPQRERPTVRTFGLGHAPELRQGIAEVRMRLGKIRTDFDDLSESLDSFGEAFELTQYTAQIVERLYEAGPAAKCLAIGRLRFGESLELE